MSAGADVLVVGAGPSGLLAAAELARHGVAARLVEREPQPHHQARATAIQPGTLEILAAAGLADRFLAASEHLGFARVVDDHLRPVGETSLAGTGGRWEIQCSLPQCRTEQLLTERLAELGGQVERGVSVVSLEPGPDGVRARLEHLGGGTETTEAGWVIGAGGAHSVTRESLDEELTGQTYPGVALAADVAVSCGLPRDGSALIATPAGYVLLAPLPGERWITFVGDLDEAEAARLDAAGPGPAATAAAAGLVRAALERRAGDVVRVDDVGWAAEFRMHRRQAPHLSGQRRFLLGDAGHLSSPFGGEGLNSGLHDAHNLAWKLALVVSGRAGPGLLATYAAERGAAAEHIIETSDQVHELAHGAVTAARTGVPARPLPPDQAAALARARAMLDTSYAGGPLTGEFLLDGAEVAEGPVPGERYPDRVALTGTRHHLLLFGMPPDPSAGGLARRWHGLVDVVQAGGDPARAGLGGPGAVLVRPDGYVGFRAAPAGPAALAAVDEHLGGYLIPA
jgi:6-methylpretetramide 4-monooxygenase / 4-hydroxy-6-methylpretetramide 12a-monooxygenase